MIAVALFALIQAGVAQPVPTQPGYAATSAGSVTAANGATITLRSEAGSSPTVPFASTGARISADEYRGQRLRLVGEIRTVDLPNGASLWLRVDGPAGRTLALDNGAARAIKGTADWTPFAVSVIAPDTATAIVFGVLMHGTGEMIARGVRLESTTEPPAAAAARELDAAFAIVKTSAYWRDTVTWSVVEPRIRRSAVGAREASEVYPAISALLAALGDHHSFFTPPRAASALQTGGAQNPAPVVRALPNGIGVVEVPGYMGMEQSATRAYATRMHDSLQKYMPGATCGWIVDLRNDTGGNMWPMLGGLKPFLGDEILGAFISSGNQQSPWKAGVPGAEPPASLAGLKQMPVAVLTGPRTASSGEAVAISFRGRPNTRSFGLPTFGLSTANNTYLLPDSAMIILTTSIEADRTGKRYGGKLDPDEVIPARPAGAGTDPQESGAVEWLKSHPTCKRS